MTATQPSLRSMTGFARADGAANGVRWTWELKSVNGKGLDLRFRLPPGYDELEQPVRDRAAKVLSRGSLQATLTMQNAAAQPRLILNEKLLNEVIEAVRRVGDRLGTMPSADSILGVRGVFEVSEDELDEEDRAGLLRHILSTFDQVLGELIEMRARRGAARLGL